MAIFDSQAVIQTLLAFAPHKRFLIAYSGGLDSHVLLHLLSQARTTDPSISLRSLYIDHGLQVASQYWSEHCQAIAAALAIDHQTISLKLQPQPGESIEAVAREARYQAFSDYLKADEILLTAQHQDDQAETLLIQLMRGAGLDGLSAMPYQKEVDGYQHIRPLLTQNRAQLEAYAHQFKLDFITDPSNADTRFDRNYLRHNILPLLKKRWPTISNTLMRSAAHLAESSHLLEEFIQQAMPSFRGTHSHNLSINALRGVSGPKQKAVLRYWIKEQGFLAPSSNKLSHLFANVINAKQDATPLLAWKNAEVRRFQNDLYIMPPLKDIPSNSTFVWDIHQELSIPEFNIRLSPDCLGDLKPPLLEQNLPISVRFRQGGERIKASQQQHSQSVKKLLQAANIPPWERARIPMIYASNQLIQVAGIATIDKKDLL